jgi:outer membrane protein assembly factor BamB
MRGFPVTVLFLSVLLLPPASSAQNGAPAPSTAVVPPADDWTTWGYDQERSAWNRGETTLAKNNVGRLGVQWSAQLSTPPTDTALSTLTAPLIVQGVNTLQGRKNLLFTLGADDTLYALDADTGRRLWQKTYPGTATAVRPATWLCSNTANDTPVIDKARNIIFFITGDGKLHGANLADGADRMPATDMVMPFARAWSLNLIDGVVYTGNARSCGEVPGEQPTLARPAAPPAQATSGSVATTGPANGAVAVGAAGGRGGRGGGPRAVEPSFSAVDVSDLDHPKVSHFFTSSTREAGPWGRGGVIKTAKGIVGQTADGIYDPAGGEFGETVLEMAPKLAGVADSFTPTNWPYLNQHDLDFGSASPVAFSYADKTIIATACKEGVIYLLDAAKLGGANHQTALYKSPLMGNDDAFGGNTNAPGQGVWGAITTYETADGKRYIYVPMWGPPSKTAPAFKTSNGLIPTGSIMAFQVSGDGTAPSLIPQWTTPNMVVPDPPVVANGVLYALQTGEQTIQNPVLPPGTPRNTPALAAKFRATPVSNLILYAFDAETGKQLYSSGKTITDWVHFSEPVVALGKVFIVTHDAHVYAFGVK